MSLVRYYLYFTNGEAEAEASPLVLRFPLVTQLGSVELKGSPRDLTTGLAR